MILIIVVVVVVEYYIFFIYIVVVPPPRGFDQKAVNTVHFWIDSSFYVVKVIVPKLPLVVVASGDV